MLLLLRFFTRNGPFFTWLGLVILCIVLLCQTNPYHRSVWLGGANVISGGVYAMHNGIAGYFSLRDQNREMMVRLAEVEEENRALRGCLRRYEEADTTLLVPRPYRYVMAQVIDNSITRAENYLILDKGSDDSLFVGMAVANQLGAIGLISKVSGHFSQVISILNPKLRLSACIKSTESAGVLVWDGDSPESAILEDVTRNVPYQIGDTVVTSGYGGSFPRGVPIGAITEVINTNNSNFLSFRVALFTHFDRINDVFVIQNTEPCPF